MAGAKAVREKQTQMLQIALTPTPVPRELVQQGRWHLFVAASQVMYHPNLPTGASHQRRLDKIMAQDLAPERRFSGQSSKPAMFDKRRDADDRIVAPIKTFSQLPEMKAGAEH